MNRSSSARLDSTGLVRGARLDLSLNGVSRGHRIRAITDGIRAAVIDGRLEPGQAVPSTRTLGRDLGVSRGAAVEAYGQLVAEGYLETVPGGGTRVAAAARAQAPTRSPIDVPATAGHNPGLPDPALFPREDWTRSVRVALSRISEADLSYGDPRGHRPLREALAAYLGRVRGIGTDADRIVVVNGVAQALVVCALILGGDERAVVAVEDPGSAGLADQLRWWGVDVRPVPVDGRGLQVASLRGIGDAAAVVVTPAHQYPTGVTLTGERRHELVNWAIESDGVVIEDDYDAEFRYDREPLTSLQPLAPDHVIAVGSVSKTLSPAMRLGWMVLPDRLVAAAGEARAYLDLGSPLPSQAALAHFLTSGAMDRHIRRCRGRYRRRRDALVETLLAGCPGLRVEGIAAGLHVLIRLDGHPDPAAVVALARSAGFAAQPLGRYRRSPGPDGVVLGYATLRPDAITTAAAQLARSLATG